MGLLELLLSAGGLFLGIVGLAMIIGSYTANERDFDKGSKANMKKVGAIVLIVAIVMVFSSSLYVVVDAGTVGVQKTFGIVDSQTMEPGLHLKNPFTEIIPMNTRTQIYMDYGTSDKATIIALSHDGLQTTMGIAVNYHLNPDKIPEIYKQVGSGYSSVVMVNPIHSVPRDLISTHDTKVLYSASVEGSQDRAKLEQELYKGIQARLDEIGVPGSIAIEQVSIREISFDAVYTASITNMMKMDTEIREKKLEVEKQKMEAERVTAEAEGTANKMRVEAQGQADAARIVAQGVLDASNKIGGVSDQYLQWYFIQTQKDNPKATYIPIGENGLPIVKTV